jgi:hypothetical protein
MYTLRKSGVGYRLLHPFHATSELKTVSQKNVVREKTFFKAEFSSRNGNINKPVEMLVHWVH